METSSEITPSEEFLEHVLPTYLSEQHQVDTGERIMRWRRGDDRRYYRIEEVQNDDGNVSMHVHWYRGVTSAVSAVLPKAEQLIRWMAEKGYAESQKHAADRAEYGTILHMLAAQLMVDGELNLDTIEQHIQGLDGVDTTGWHEDLRRDLMAWAQFAADYNVQPVAIEIPLYSDAMGIASCIDLVCSMQIEEKGFHGEVYKSGARKGDPKATKQTRDIMAIIDLKSGRKGIYESHKWQLELYRMLWHEWFPEITIDRLYNWRPKDWTTRPGYYLTEKNGSPSSEEVESGIAFASRRMEAKPSGWYEYPDRITLGDAPEDPVYRDPDEVAIYDWMGTDPECGQDVSDDTLDLFESMQEGRHDADKEPATA